MERRLEFHAKLESIPGVKKAYFQAPSTVKMKYPCVRYNRDGAWQPHANDRMYQFQWRYSVVVIDPNPDTKIPELLAKSFPHTRFDRFYTADNLNHYVFTIYY